MNYLTTQDPRWQERRKYIWTCDSCDFQTDDEGELTFTQMFIDFKKETGSVDKRCPLCGDFVTERKVEE